MFEFNDIDLARLMQEQQCKPLDMVWVSYYWQQVCNPHHTMNP